MLDKYNRLKKRSKEDIRKLQVYIEKQNGIIEALKERNNGLKARDMYQLWLKERMETIKKYKEIDKLLDENTKLKKQLTIKILAKTLKE